MPLGQLVLVLLRQPVLVLVMVLVPVLVRQLVLVQAETYPPP